MKLTEKYRPRELSGVLGQDKAIQKLQIAARNGYAGKAYYITGATGIGKTTLARIIASEIADPDYIQEVDAANLSVNDVQTMEQESNYGSFGKGGRVYIVNECHALPKRTVTQLLTTLERIPGHVAWIFTTTIEGDSLFEEHLDAKPFVTRCVQVNLTSRDLSATFAKRAIEIARAESLLALDDEKAYTRALRCVKDCGNSMRALLESVDSGLLAV